MAEIATWEIELVEGDDFERFITAQDESQQVIDLTGYSSSMKFYDKKGSSTPDLECSTANGKITIDGPGGQIQILIDSDDIASLPWTRGYHEWKMTDSLGKTTTWTKGPVKVV